MLLLYLYREGLVSKNLTPCKISFDVGFYYWNMGTCRYLVTWHIKACTKQGKQSKLAITRGDRLIHLNLLYMYLCSLICSLF